MKHCYLLVLLLAGCYNPPHILTYEELVAYPVQCEIADSQLHELKILQRIKNFNADPDELNAADSMYNSRLKATIWWYAYRCEPK